MSEKNVNRKRKLAEEITRHLSIESTSHYTPKSTSFNVENRQDYIRELTHHLDVLFEDFDAELFIEIRPLGKPKEREFFENTAANREKIARKYVFHENLCVGLHPRLAEKGTADATLEARFLVVDFDPKDKERPIGITPQDITTFLDSFGLKPRLIVSTGNGYHAYLKTDTVFSVFEFTRLQEALISFLNKHISFENAHADNAIKDAPRLIRLAATLNTKNNETKLTRIVYEDPEAVVRLEDIYELVRDELKESKQTSEANADVITDDALLRLIETIKQQFTEGRRQFLVLGLAGVLAKNGRSEEEALQIYRQHFSSIDDPKDLRMREIGIRRTFKLHQSGREVAGYSLLRQYGVEIAQKATNVEHRAITPEHALKIIDAETLTQMEFEKRRIVVENLITEGLNLLAGKSKLGKSWFGLYLALHVATNTPPFGLFKVDNGNQDVYYFALEDYEERIRSRKEKLLQHIHLNGSAQKLKFVFNTRQYRFALDERGFAILDQFAKNACLIIIDTYGRAKPNKNYKNEYAYETDILSRLQQIAFDNHTSILLIHHTRKMYSDEVFDNVLGSTALIGVADTTIVFERMRKQDLVKLHITGRDVEEQSIALKFEREKGIFHFEGNAEIMELTELQREALEILRTEALTFSELKKRLNKPDGTVYKVLTKLREEGLIDELKQSKRTIYKAK